MDLLLIKAAILGIVEGLTEFLPISSTGHLILAAALLGFDEDLGDQTAATFEIAIQTGAMLAVIWQFRARLITTLARLPGERTAQRFALNVVIAFLPAAVIGVLATRAIKSLLFNPVTVALAFAIGGIIILVVERRLAKSKTPPRIDSIDAMTSLDALKVGLAQCLALIPGTSRSGATIIGGLLVGLSRRVATEFSFYLAIPTLVGAGVWSVWKQRDTLSAAHLPVFAVGFVVAFVAALLCIRWLLRFIATHDFKPFAWYRIVFGIVILAAFESGALNWAN